MITTILFFSVKWENTTSNEAPHTRTNTIAKQQHKRSQANNAPYSRMFAIASLSAVE